MKIRKCIEKFIDTVAIERNLSERTLKTYLGDLTSFNRFFQDKNIGEVTTDDIRDYIRDLEMNNNYKDTTIRRKIASIKVFFNFLEHEEVIPKSPTRRISRKYIVSKRLPKVMSGEEVERLLRVAHEETTIVIDSCQKEIDLAKSSNKMLRAHRNNAILEILFSTGIRIGELVKLNIQDFRTCDRTLSILGKGGVERIAWDCRKLRKVYLELPYEN